MRKMFVWFIICALLILVVNMVKAQAIHALGNQCHPAIVEWQSDSSSVVSFGCVDFRKDSLIIIPHLIDGFSMGELVVQKPQVTSVTLLKATQKATFKRANIPP